MKKILSFLLFSSLIFNGSLFAANSYHTNEDIVMTVNMETENFQGENFQPMEIDTVHEQEKPPREAFREALEAGSTLKVQKLLDTSNIDLSIPFRDEELRYYMYPLGYAALYGDKSMTELLLSAGAHPQKGNISFETRERQTPEEIAEENQHNEVKDLIKEHATLLDEFHKACYTGYTQEMRELLKKGVNPNHEQLESTQTYFRQFSPLLIATENEKINAVRLLLLQQEVNPNDGSRTSYYERNEENKHFSFTVSPLYVACGKNNLKLVKLLVKSKADPNRGYSNSNPFHSSPLSVSCEQGGLKDIVATLLQNGADIKTVENLDESTLSEDVRFELRWHQRRVIPR